MSEFRTPARARAGLFALLVLTVFGFRGVGECSESSVERPGPSQTDVTRFRYDRLDFEPALGRYNAAVDFVARGPDYVVFLAGGQPTIVTADWRRSRDRGDRAQLGGPTAVRAFQMELIGAQAPSAVTQQEQGHRASNDLRGADPALWRNNTPVYGRVRYADVYPGIDVVYYGNGTVLQHDFIVEPGVNPAQIELRFHGADQVSLDGKGDIHLHVAGTEFIMHAPIAYQMLAGRRVSVESRFVVTESNLVQFALGSYDRERELVIDPTLAYSVFVGGGSSEYGLSVAVDDDGNAYLVGHTISIDFPVTPDELVGECGTGGVSCDLAHSDVFVTKISPTADTVLYSTTLGGVGDDVGYYVDVDGQGRAYVVGRSDSDDFPVTRDTAFQPDRAPSLPDRDGSDGIFFVLSPDGKELVYSTYLGGEGGDVAYALGLRPPHSAVIVGYTESDNFAVVGNADVPDPLLQRATFGGTEAFVSVFDISAKGQESLLFSSLIGGSGAEFANAVAVDPDNATAYIAGSTTSSDFQAAHPACRVGCAEGATCFGGATDMFLLAVDISRPDALSCRYSRLIGGKGIDEAYGIAVDGVGAAYVVGETSSPNMVTSLEAAQSDFGGAVDGFVAKVSPDGGILEYATYLGGLFADSALAVGVDAGGNAYVAGETAGNFPVLRAPQPAYQGGEHDGFVVRINALGSSLVYSTYLGGGGDDTVAGLVFADQSSAYVAGSTRSPNFPVRPVVEGVPRVFDPSCGTAPGCNGGRYDAFVAKVATTADLAVRFDPVRAAIPVGGTVVYVLNVLNGGPDLATDVVLAGSLPAHSADVQLVPGQGSCTYSDGHYRCQLGELAPIGSTSLRISLIPTMAGRISATAAVSATEFDPTVVGDGATTSGNFATADGPEVGEPFDYSPSGAIGWPLLLVALTFLALRFRRSNLEA